MGQETQRSTVSWHRDTRRKDPGDKTASSTPGVGSDDATSQDTRDDARRKLEIQ